MQALPKLADSYLSYGKFVSHSVDLVAVDDCFVALNILIRMQHSAKERQQLCMTSDTAHR